MSAVSISTTCLTIAGFGKLSGTRALQQRFAFIIVPLDDQGAGLINKVEIPDPRHAVGAFELEPVKRPIDVSRHEGSQTSLYVSCSGWLLKRRVAKRYQSTQLTEREGAPNAVWIRNCKQ